MISRQTRRNNQGGDRLDDQRGAVSLYFAVAMVGFLLVITLVVDGSAYVRANQRAEAVAAEAARAGGQAIDTGDVLANGQVALDPYAARRAARDYLAAAGVTGTVRIINGTRLSVSTTVTVDAGFGYLAIPDTASGEAEAELHQGGN